MPEKIFFKDNNTRYFITNVLPTRCCKKYQTKYIILKNLNKIR